MMSHSTSTLCNSDLSRSISIETSGGTSTSTVDTHGTSQLKNDDVTFKNGTLDKKIFTSCSSSQNKTQAIEAVKKKNSFTEMPKDTAGGFQNAPQMHGKFHKRMQQNLSKQRQQKTDHFSLKEQKQLLRQNGGFSDYSSHNMNNHHDKTNYNNNLPNCYYPQHQSETMTAFNMQSGDASNYYLKRRNYSSKTNNDFGTNTSDTPPPSNYTNGNITTTTNNNNNNQSRRSAYNNKNNAAKKQNNNLYKRVNDYESDEMKFEFRHNAFNGVPKPAQGVFYKKPASSDTHLQHFHNNNNNFQYATNTTTALIDHHCEYENLNELQTQLVLNQKVASSVPSMMMLENQRHYTNGYYSANLNAPPIAPTCYKQTGNQNGSLLPQWNTLEMCNNGDEIPSSRGLYSNPVQTNNPYCYYQHNCDQQQLLTTVINEQENHLITDSSLNNGVVPMHLTAMFQNIDPVDWSSLTHQQIYCD